MRDSVIYLSPWLNSKTAHTDLVEFCLQMKTVVRPTINNDRSAFGKGIPSEPKAHFDLPTNNLLGITTLIP